jgi:hypothetical protein
MYSVHILVVGCVVLTVNQGDTPAFKLEKYEIWIVIKAICKCIYVIGERCSHLTQYG